jgi:5'-phosphate synthase pdxT subunit
MKIGVLDIQGDVSEHLDILGRIGVDGVRVRKTKDLEGVSGLILPGGESTVIGPVMKQRGITQFVTQRSLPLMGTCAGIILMAKLVDGKPGVVPVLDIVIKRNGYGSQRESFETDLTISGIGNFRGVFIRAPVITGISGGEVLSSYRDHPVMVKEGKNLGLTFHPEIYGDERIHRLFLDGL